MKTYRSIGPLLSSVLSWTSLKINMYVVDDVKKIFNNSHFSVDWITAGILKKKKIKWKAWKKYNHEIIFNCKSVLYFQILISRLLFIWNGWEMAVKVEYWNVVTDNSLLSKKIWEFFRRFENPERISESLFLSPISEFLIIGIEVFAIKSQS